MSLEFAILGFLNYLPLSGYDLKKRFDKSIRHFWPADQSQIYQSLARLTERGLVEVEEIAQTGRPNRKVYHITEAGRAALRAWLAGPLPPQETRHAPLIQVFFGAQLADAELLALFEELARAARERLAHLEQSRAMVDEYAAALDLPRDAFCWALTLELGVKSNQAQLEWAESVIARLRRGRLPQRRAGTPRRSGKGSRGKQDPRHRRDREAG